MKQRIFLPFSILAAACLLVTCDLEEEPYGFYSEDNFYQTEADALSATLYIYDAITYIEYSRAIVFLGDMNTDEIGPKGDATQSNQDLDEWVLNNFKSNTTLGNFFKYSYVTINRANAVIKNVAAMDIDQDLIDRYVGEAYFMRAYSYWNLTRNFGRVPIHTSVVETLADTEAALAETFDDMWALIFSDLETACDLLYYYDTPETGRADLAAAQSLMAKAYLYLATAKEHGTPYYEDMSFDVDDYYEKAVEWASLVVDNPEQTTYYFDDDLFDIYDVEQPDGPEHIFIMSMDRTGESEGQYSKISKMYIPYVSGGTIYIKGKDGVIEATHDGWGEYQTEDDFYDSFESGDLRHDDLICSEIYTSDGELYGSVDDGKLSYPFCRKYIDPSFSGDKTSTKPYLIRFSDVALVYAEAAGPTDKAYELVNTIRARAGLDGLATGMSTSEFREAVLQERLYELAFEGNICYDLRRWNKLHTDITAAVEQGLTAEDMVFYPIPSIETDLNSSIE